jgi:signal transduction histidine kinase
MNVIQGHAENLEEAIEQDDIERQVEIIRDTAQDVGRLSEHVSDLERLVEKDASVRERTNIAEVVQMVATELHEEYPEATIEVTVEEDAYVSVDEGFRVALEHAIANAVEHNDTDDSRVTITLGATDRETIITVEDNGPGIPEMEIDALGPTSTPVKHGSGLGPPLIQFQGVIEQFPYCEYATVPNNTVQRGITV